MDFGQSIKTCFSKFFDFSGRARRSEYWWFYLFSAITSIVLGWVPLLGLVTLVLVIPGLSAGARRLHDTGRSGWWQLSTWIPGLIGLVLVGLSFVPKPEEPDVVLLSAGGLFWLVSAVMWIVLTVFMATDTVPGNNQYGPPPK